MVLFAKNIACQTFLQHGTGKISSVCGVGTWVITLHIW